MVLFDVYDYSINTDSVLHTEYSYSVLYLYTVLQIAPGNFGKGIYDFYEYSTSYLSIPINQPKTSKMPKLEL